MSLLTFASCFIANSNLRYVNPSCAWQTVAFEGSSTHVIFGHWSEMIPRGPALLHLFSMAESITWCPSTAAHYVSQFVIRPADLWCSLG